MPQIALRIHWINAMVLVFLISGCSMGKHNVLFVTKTSLGVDIDSKPPAIDIGYDRKEGTVAPVFDDGQVLSQMAGFSAKVGFVNQAAGQSFATGNAAELMSKYLISNARVATGDTIPPGDIGKIHKLNRTGDPKRYFFGTDTSFGLKVNLGVETGGIPDALSLGYKRKELAFVPLIEKQLDQDTVEVALPSLISTAGFDNRVSVNDSNLYLRQFFATGQAADYLAAIPGIRQEVVPKMIPDAEAVVAYVRDADFTERSKQERIEKLLLLVDASADSLVYQLNGAPPIQDPAADNLISQMDRACQRLATRDCNEDGDPDTGGAGATGDPEIARRMLKFRIVMSGKRSDDELDAWEGALKGGSQ